MKASPETLKDVLKYYGETYVVIPEISEQHVMYLKTGSDKGLVCVDSRDKRNGFISFEDGFEYELRAPLATRKSWFMHEGSAYFLTRIPARMWRKGISAENTAIFKLNVTNDLSKTQVTPSLLNAYLQYVPDDSVPKPRTNQVPSPEWAFNGHTNSLFLWHSLVGKYARRTNELFVPQELKSLALPAMTKNMKVQYV